jgi:hypothetical protein
MAVYVDDMYLFSIGSYRGMKMSHMIADTQAELIDMARKIGLNTQHIQYRGTYREHFDVSLGYRCKAIKAGAIPISMRDLARRTKARKLIGEAS